MTDIREISSFLAGYDGPELSFMEVCGSHTAAIEKNGIKSILSDRIHLICGPGCPVCVTPTAYIDRAIALAGQEHMCLVTFGDLLRVPGSEKTLAQAKGEGARAEMVYSPMDILAMAEREPDTTFVFAAIGFETTAPVYALLLDTLVDEKRKNIRLLTAMKTMPKAVERLCAEEHKIDGFLAPGHVCVVTGSRAFAPAAERFSLPFAVSGFSGEEILMALYALVRARGQGTVMNFYPSVVTEEGNQKAQELVDRYFAVSPATWRGLGCIEDSGLLLREEYREFDAGSDQLTEDKKSNPACRCDKVLTGRLDPTECPLFAKVCTPLNPQGACMVSEEGSCSAAFRYRR